MEGAVSDAKAAELLGISVHELNRRVEEPPESRSPPRVGPDIVKVLVSDTSVLIDAERGSLLKFCFGLPFVFVVPDLLYRQELQEHGGPALIQLGLRVEELDGDGVSLALGYRRDHRSLSLPDSFALALARLNSWILLSGDGGLREPARSEGVVCHGVLWLIDRGVRIWSCLCRPGVLRSSGNRGASALPIAAGTKSEQGFGSTVAADQMHLVRPRPH